MHAAERRGPAQRTVLDAGSMGEQMAEGRLARVEAVEAELREHRLQRGARIELAGVFGQQRVQREEGLGGRCDVEHGVAVDRCLRRDVGVTEIALVGDLAVLHHDHRGAGLVGGRILGGLDGASQPGVVRLRGAGGAVGEERGGDQQ